MIAALLLLLQTAGQPASSPETHSASPSAPPSATPVPVSSGVAFPPQDWSDMPVLRIRKRESTLANTSAYVHGEVMAGRCAKAVRTQQGWTLTLDLAVLLRADGRIRRVTPRAIDCPTVEQYAAGVILGVRDAIDVIDTDTDTWYRTSLTFAWGA